MNIQDTTEDQHKQPENQKQEDNANSNSNAHIKPQHTQKLSDLFLQLSDYIDNLSDKFNEVKEKHQADFLIAYKNHMTKIKRELQELKQKSEDQERMMQQNDRLINMERQLNWFREESIKLYQKLENKNKENYELNFKIYELEKDKSFLESQVKSLLKKNRMLEVHMFNNQQSNNSQPQLDDPNQQQSQPNDDNTFFTAALSNKSKTVIKSLDVSDKTLINSPHFLSSKEIITKYLPPEQDAFGMLLELTAYIKSIELKKDKTIKQLKTKLDSIIKQTTRINTVRSDLETFFLDCVETVRRQVLKRKQPNHTQQMKNYMNSIKDYSVFRIEDKLKILELLLTHEKLLVFLYQKIFPTHFSTYVSSFNAGLEGNKLEKDVDLVAHSFQERNHLMIQEGLPEVSRDKSMEIKPTQQNREQRSHSVKVSDKLVVKKGKLVFKPI